MKEVTSTCEKEFIKNLVILGKRLDGRTYEESRSVQLVFGKDHGCCLATLGDTRVLSQISCELTAPRENRPSEGQLHVNVEFTAMAAPPTKDSGGRWSGSDINVQPSRQLERTLRDSRCIDLESLCIVAGKKVWSLRVDVHVLNHDGNVIECASIAAVASLLHFRRPDVTVSGVDVVVHPLEERDPVPLSLLHWPFCCTAAIYQQGEQMLSDPTELEERVSEGCIVISMNAHQELCMLHLGGHTALVKDKLLVCSRRAFQRVKVLTALVKEALQTDKVLRAKGRPVGFAARLQVKGLLVTRQEPKQPSLDDMDVEEPSDEIILEDETITLNGKDPNEMDQEPKILQIGKGAVMMGEGGPSSWESLGGPSRHPKKHRKKSKTKTNLGVASSGSEEEETTIMDSMETV